MDKFLDKFNIFDLFTMLIPGIMIATLIGISLSFQFYKNWSEIGGEKYFFFFVFSYLIGVSLQEFGTILDQKLLMKLVYGGRIREIYLLEDHYKSFFDNRLSYETAKYVKNYILNLLDIEKSTQYNEVTEKEYNSFIYSYCTSFLEINGLSGKADKMSVISEMSRSLFYGFILVIIINLFLSFQITNHWIFFLTENIILLMLSIIFIRRKIRYEKYRLRTLFRTFLIVTRS